MTDKDAANMPDGKDLLRTMVWESLPYSCLGLVRKTGDIKGDNIWSWIILIPWTSDGKPWIDGTEIVSASLKSEEDENREIVAKMRTILDERYGETVAHRAVDDLIAEILDQQ